MGFTICNYFNMMNFLLLCAEKELRVFISYKCLFLLITLDKETAVVQQHTSFETETTHCSF